MFLSTENPPNDPSSSSNFLHLTSYCDELGQSHHNGAHHPDFSIRNYVCSYRSKDIKNNWPFSSKSLQLCLNHGINDPLPPFQPPGAVGNQCGKICPFEACMLEKQTIPNVKVKIPSFLCDKSKVDNLCSNQALTETRKGVQNSGIRRFGVENGLLPSISGSQSEMKVPTMNKHLSKKCGQLLKAGAHVNRMSKEDNCLATSESMASKTCPICKTFSSASNTTLNAHIDQCLSVDSAQPTTKPNRHRIKPRRVRTMTDIYSTAKGCTLEELDKRNGTMWTMIPKHSNRVADKPELSRRGKKSKVLPATLDEDVISVGPVYVDDRGQKLRILSEFCRENSSSLLREDKDVSLKTKSSKEGKGSKWCSTKKKGRRGKKHHKYLRLIPQCRKLVSQKVNASEMPEHQEGFSGEGSGMEKTQTPKQLKPGQPRILNQRMLAKRTGLSRKLKKKGQKFQASCDQPLENEDWSGDPILFRSPTHKFTDLSVSVSSPLNKQEIWRTFGESQVIGKNEAFLRRNGSQSPSLRVRMTENKERSFVTVQHNKDQSKKNLASTHERNSAEKVISTDAARYSDGSPGARCAKKLSPAFAAKASRFSMSVDKLSISVPKTFRKPKKARFHLSEKEDEEMGKWESEMTQECALMDDDSDSGKTYEVLMSPNSLIDSDDDYDDDESSEKDANREDDLLDITDGADDEFYQSDTPPSTEICNGNTSTRDHEICYSEEVGDMFYGQTAGDGAEPDSRVGPGSSFMEVDHIPIPEPPGSFVPSPRDVGSDDYLGISSVITSQVQSSQDQLDLIDRNSSESPLSAVSTHSNSAAVKSTHADFPAEFSSVQEMINLDQPTSNSVIPVDCAASSQQANAEPKQSSDTEKVALRGITIDKGSFPFRNNDWPCCCQRKERFPEGFVINHHESELLKRRAASSVTIPETKMPTSVDPNRMPSNSEILLDMFEPYTFQDSNLHSKFQNSMNRAATSPSIPVLRLMGKDLMVVNQGEEAPMPASHTESSQRPTPQVLGPSGPVESGIQTFHHGTPHHSSTLLWSSCAATNVYCDTGLYFGNNASSATPQTPAEASAVDAFGNNFHLLRYFSPS